MVVKNQVDIVSIFIFMKLTVLMFKLFWFNHCCFVVNRHDYQSELKEILFEFYIVFISLIVAFPKQYLEDVRFYNYLVSFIIYFLKDG